MPTVPCLFRVIAVLMLIISASCHHKHVATPDYPPETQTAPSTTDTPPQTQTPPATVPTVTATNGNVPALGPTLPGHVVIPPATAPGVTK